MKSMAGEMQRELETTRAELRRGILELPQETADSTAQMRRVIVDQIEALAELNRIVARHGRGLDTVRGRAARGRADSAPHAGACICRRRTRRSGAAAAAAAARPPVRSDITEAPRPAMRGDITGAPPRRQDLPSLTPGQTGERQPQRLAVRPAHPRLAR